MLQLGLKVRGEICMNINNRVRVAKRFRLSKKERKNLTYGLLFLSPWILGFLLFELYPVVASAVYSLCNYNGIQDAKFVGLDNYIRLFTKDKLFYTSLYNTVFFGILSVPMSILTSLMIAMLLNAKTRGLAFFRTVFYMPTIMPAVASTMLWLWILNPAGGILNNLLAVFGIQGPGWFGDPRWSKPALVFISVWTAGQVMVIFLAGLQDVPEQLYESARLDGAGFFARTFKITLPMISPVIFFNLLMGIIGSFQYFTQAYVLNPRDLGKPLNSTMFYALYLYQNAFEFGKMGYASSMAWILFVIIFSSTFIVMKVSQKFVFYDGE